MTISVSPRRHRPAWPTPASNAPRETTAEARPIAASIPRPSLNAATVLLFGVVFSVGQVIGRVSPPIDFLMYWNAIQGGLHYPDRWADQTLLYVYPPPLAQALQAVAILGQPLLMFLWQMSLWGCFVYLARWAAWPLILLGMAHVAGLAPSPSGEVLGYVMLGNVQLMVAATVVIGLRHPAAWAAVFLTKIGPGVGIIWFGARREWRALALSLAATGAVVAVSCIIAPSDWLGWWAFVQRNTDMYSGMPMTPIAFPIRLAMSALLVVWGARTNRPWTVPIAAGWSIPALYVWSFLPVWLGVIALSGRTPGLPNRLIDRLRVVGRPALDSGS